MQEIQLELLGSAKDIFAGIMKNVFSNYRHVLRWETIIALHYTHQSERSCWNHCFLFHSLKLWLIDYGEQHFGHVPLVFNKTPYCLVVLVTKSLIKCNNFKTNELVKSYTIQQDPLIISDLTEATTSKKFSTLFLDRTLNYVVHIGDK